MEKDKDNFSALEQFFKDHFGGQNLQYYVCQPVFDCEQKYLRICHNLTSSELKYLPTFHIVGKVIVLCLWLNPVYL